MSRPKNFLPRAQYLATLPKKRSGAGIILRDKEGRILLVKPSYKDHWSLPGGVVDAKESPARTCIREAGEEIGIGVIIKRLLAVVYSKGENGDGESYQFIFDGGILSERKIGKIKVDNEEIVEAKFVPLSKIESYAGSDRAERLRKYQLAVQKGKTVFIDDGSVLM